MWSNSPLDQQAQHAVARGRALVAIELAQPVQIDEGDGQVAEPWRSAR